MPRVSVVIATYNWSEALACALRSVRLQTFQDYEVLVAGDACTDDSESVVAAVNDPRFRWFNRETNAGSQWAPNNDAIARSGGEFIAYLGHDDLWYPTHLESLVRVADGRKADIACATAVMYGPPETGVRAVCGIFADGVMDERQFVVPSSMLHTRSLIDRIGPWRDARTLPIPTDCDLVLRALRAGAVFAATDELSVFKFNAAWRRDAYGRRPTQEQRAMLARIESGEDFRAAELVEVIRAMISRRNIEVRMPIASEQTRRAIARTREFKGAPGNGGAIVRRLVTRSAYTLDNQPGSLEWYPVERSARFGSFRWSGPSSVSTLRFPIDAPPGTVLEIRVVGFNGDARAFTLEINGHAAATHTTVESGLHVVRAEVGATAGEGRAVSVCFRVPATTPKPGDDDRRPRGVAVHSVTFVPPRS
ncbi:MAG: glycosyltransferase [Phycisphaerae bacterium]|nr:glycosyltransferase [Phycisphaerae bacterium]